MLPAAHRLRRSNDFSSAMRAGRRSGRGSVVVHLAVIETARSTDTSPKAPSESPTRTDGAFGVSGPDVTTVTTGTSRPGDPLVSRAGFVVSKAVGNAVVRNKVKRRLRQLVAERLPGLPAGSTLVVRALPQAASASYEQLGLDLDGALAGAQAPRRKPRGEQQRLEQR